MVEKRERQQPEGKGKRREIDISVNRKDCEKQKDQTNKSRGTTILYRNKENFKEVGVTKIFKVRCRQSRDVGQRGSLTVKRT